MTQEKSELPLAAMTVYGDAIKKRDALVKKIKALQADLEKHDLMIKGMDEIISLLNVQRDSKESSNQPDEAATKSTSFNSSIKKEPKWQRRSDIWATVMEWMGEREVEVAEVCRFCEENDLGVTRKQVRNWLNNARIGGKLERVGNATYRKPNKREMSSFVKEEQLVW